MILGKTTQQESLQTNKHYSYRIVSACFTIQAVGVGTLVSYGVFFNSLMTEFQWSRAAISGASSLAFFLSGLFAMLLGRLNDRYGPKNLMRIASIFFGVGLMLMSQLHDIWQLYLFYGLFFGIGLSAIDVIALTTIARRFSRNRGIMTGLVKVGTGAGQFIIPLAAGMLIAVYGWRHAYLCIGVGSLIILLSCAQLLKRDAKELSPGRHARNRSEKVHPKIRDISLSVGETVRTFQMWTICIVNLLIVFCLMIILVHIVPHSRDIGLSAIQAAGVLSTIGAVSMVGRLVAGITIDRIGSKPIMVTCLFVLITSLLWLQVSESLWMLYLFACVYGLAHGGLYTAISPIVAEIFGIAAHGTIFGIILFFGATGGAIGPFFAGQLFDITGSYTIIFRSITILSIIGLLLLSLLKPINKNK
jgi:MFS family permease